MQNNFTPSPISQLHKFLKYALEEGLFIKKHTFSWYLKFHWDKLQNMKLSQNIYF